jgi:acyl carrier protein
MSKLEDLLKETFRVEKSDYTDDTEIIKFKEWDSMAHMFLITKLEELYNVNLNGDEIADMKTVGQIKSTLKKHSVVEI